MRTENVKIAAQYIRELGHIEGAILGLERSQDRWIEFTFGFHTFKVEKLVVLKSLQDQSEKIKFTIKSLGVED